MSSQNLNDKEKTLLAFSLFTTGMRIGPVVFGMLCDIAEKTGISDRLEFYAKDWSDFAENARKAGEQGVTLFEKYRGFENSGLMDL